MNSSVNYVEKKSGSSNNISFGVAIELIQEGNPTESQHNKNRSLPQFTASVIFT